MTRTGGKAETNARVNKRTNGRQTKDREKDNQKDETKNGQKNGRTNRWVGGWIDSDTYGQRNKKQGRFYGRGDRPVAECCKLYLVNSLDAVLRVLL